MKEFNVTGSCNPAWHYMVDTSKRFEAIIRYVDTGKYFTINRARQFGKTTTLDMIWRKLSDRYLVIALSFEGVGDTPFESDASFAGMICRHMASYLEQIAKEENLARIWKDSNADSMDSLSDTITKFTAILPVTRCWSAISANLSTRGLTATGPRME